MKFVRNKGKEGGGAATPSAPPRPPRRKAGKSREGKAPRGSKKFVLVVGDEGGILIYMQGNTVLRRLFAASPQPDHTSTFAELLSGNPKVPLYVLCDVLDQQYVRHSFPPVSALSVGNLVKRRLERDFQPSDLTSAIQLGREKTGRKEWQYLLVALAITPMLQQWFDLLVELPNEFKGIYLSPVEGQSYLNSLHKAFSSEKPLPWQLLVSHHKVSGFRQIVLRNGKLAFTRVTQAIDDALPAVVAGNIEQEIMNTLEYLRRLGFQESETLEMMVITSQEVQEALDIRRFKAGQSFVLTPLEIAEAMGLEHAALSADRFGDVVMGAAFARTGKRQMKLMTAYAQKLSQLYMARMGLKVVGALLVLALVGSSLMNVGAMISGNRDAADVEAQQQPVRAQLETVRKSVLGLNENVALKSAIMLTYDAYMKDVHPPSEFIDKLAPLLTPETRVAKFSWGPIGSTTSSGEGVPSATPGSDKTGVEARVDFEFNGKFSSIEDLAKFAEKYVASLKAAMPEYTIFNLPYPWQVKGQSSVEISFDQQNATAQLIKEGQNKATLIFRLNPTTGVPGAPSGGPGMGAP